MDGRTDDGNVTIRDARLIARLTLIAAGQQTSLGENLMLNPGFGSDPGDLAQLYVQEYDAWNLEISASHVQSLTTANTADEQLPVSFTTDPSTTKVTFGLYSNINCTGKLKQFEMVIYVA